MSVIPFLFFCNRIEYSQILEKVNIHPLHTSLHTHHKVTNNVYGLTCTPEATVTWETNYQRPNKNSDVLANDSWETETQRPFRSLVKLRFNWQDKERMGVCWTDRETLALTEFAQRWLCFSISGKNRGSGSVLFKMADGYYIWQWQYRIFPSSRKFYGTELL